MRGTRWLAAAVEGLLVSLVAVGLAASAGSLPVIGWVLLPLLPVPFVALGLRHGRPALLLALCVASALLALPGSLAPGLIFLLAFGLPTLLMAEGLRRGLRTEVIVVAAAAVIAAAWLTVMAFPEGFAAAMRANAQTLAATMETFLAQVGAEGESAVPVATLGAFLATAFIGLFFTVTLLYVAACVGLLLVLVRRWPGQLGGVAAGGFRWELPEVLVWAFIAAGLCYLSGQPWLYEIGVNGLIVLVGLYFLQGLSIAAFLFERFKLPRLLGMLSVVLLVFQPLFTLLVAALGLFDVWFAFRRLSLPKNSRGATS